VDYGFNHLDYEKVLNIVERELNIKLEEREKKYATIDFDWYLPTENGVSLYGISLRGGRGINYEFDDDADFEVDDVGDAFEYYGDGSWGSGEIEGSVVFQMILYISDELLEFDGIIQKLISEGTLDCRLIVYLPWPEDELNTLT
jgi:hypothetical protein